MSEEKIHLELHPNALRLLSDFIAKQREQLLATAPDASNEENLLLRGALISLHGLVETVLGRTKTTAWIEIPERWLKK